MSFVNETPESAKFRTRGRVLEKAAKGDEVMLRAADGTRAGYASVASVLPTGLLVALALDGTAGADLHPGTEVWLPDGDGDPGPPPPAHTTNAAPGLATCVVCGAQQPAQPFAEPLRCPHCATYLAVGDAQTRELGPNQLMPLPSLLVPLQALTGPVHFPPTCACCGGPPENFAEVTTAGSMHQPMTSGPLDFVFREISVTRTLAPSWYETYRSAGSDSGSGAGGGPTPAWQFPLCGVDNRDHRDPVMVWTQDGALGFRSYRYYREFCQANRLIPAR